MTVDEPGQESGAAPADRAVGTSQAGPGSPGRADPGEGHTEPPGQQAEDEQDDARPSHREQKYRTALRRAETERDQWRERVQHLQRGEAERIASTGLADAQDLWVGCKLDELLDTDGNISAEVVEAKVAELVERRPHWGKQQVKQRIPVDRLRSGASGPSDVSTGTTWADVLRPES